MGAEWHSAGRGGLAATPLRPARSTAPATAPAAAPRHSPMDSFRANSENEFSLGPPAAPRPTVPCRAAPAVRVYVPLLTIFPQGQSARNSVVHRGAAFSAPAAVRQQSGKPHHHFKKTPTKPSHEAEILLV